MTVLPDPLYTGHKYATKGVADDTRKVLPFEPWMDFGACRIEGIDPILFYPLDGGTKIVRAAKTVCSRCIHQTECLDYAIRNNITDGIWGGHTPSERKTTVKRNRLLATPTPFVRESPHG